ncbi:MAG TPA: hypothetical protein VH277_05240 [Gemmatimonadaceae bacterium]|nr:hypothetical protein [Gemmatimonadaceae bacterium]
MPPGIVPATLTRRPELRRLQRLETPRRVQDFLDAIPINHERRRETCSSALTALRRNSAHCMEGALVAALALWFQGHPPLLLDLKTSRHDVDHVVALYRRGGYWGAITKTNHAVLRFREPIYRDPRELAASYFHEYFLNDGRKTLRSFSRPYDLRQHGTDWVTRDDDLWDIQDALDRSPHVSLIDRSRIAGLRRADAIEIRAGRLVEWR